MLIVEISIIQYKYTNKIFFHENSIKRSFQIFKIISIN